MCSKEGTFENVKRKGFIYSVEVLFYHFSDSQQLHFTAKAVAENPSSW